MDPGWTLLEGGRPLAQDELPDAVSALLKAAGDRKIWLLHGEMGAGKTTLVKALGRALGVQEGMSSPTFSLVNEYSSTGGKLYHFDLYRLTSEKEIFDIGVEEYFDSGGWCLVEWPEKLGALTPAGSFRVNIEMTDPTHRRIAYQHDSKK